MINLTNVGFSYGKKSPLFSGLNFRIDSGGIYGLLGKNGAGKTSFLKLSTGLLFPQTGSCEVFRRPAHDRSPSQLSQIAFVPEEFELPSMSAAKYFELLKDFYPGFDADALEDYLGQFELEASNQLSQMSFGQRKKALLAFVIASGAKLVVLDEPTNGLDIPGKQALRKILAGVADEERAFIISSHQVRDVQSIIDPIVILDEGTVVFNADLETINRRLAVVRVAEDELPPDSLAWQPAVGGMSVLVPRTGAYQSAGGEIDIELLFQAVTENHRAIDQLFAEETAGATGGRV